MLQPILEIVNNSIVLIDQHFGECKNGDKSIFLDTLGEYNQHQMDINRLQQKLLDPLIPDVKKRMYCARIDGHRHRQDQMHRAMRTRHDLLVNELMAKNHGEL